MKIDKGEYLRLKREEDVRLKQAMADYQKFPLNVNDNFLLCVPETKREEVVRSTKMEVIEKNMAYAKERLLKLNSPLKDREIAALTVNYRNLYRQLRWNETRLELINNKQEVKDDKDNKVWSYQIKFLIDKISTELDLLREELDLYGLTPEEVLHEV